MWGTEYALLTHSPSLGFTGEFICNPATPTTDAQTFGGKTFAGYIRTTGNLATWTNGKAELKTIDYDIKTTSTTFTIYVGNTVKSTPQLYYVVYDESSEAHSGPDVVQTAIGDALPYNSNTSYSTRSVTIERSKNARVCFYTSASSKTNIYQIIANETGTPLPKVGEGGYALNMVSGRFCATNETNIAKVDHNLTIDMYNSYNMGTGSNVTLYPNDAPAGDHYLSFTTPANPGKLKVTFSGKGTLVYSTKKDGTSTTTMTTGSEYTLSGNTLYYLYNTVPAKKIQITKLEFIPIAPTFSVSADAELTAEEDAVTLTSAGNTVYYKWSTNSSAYAANAGSTLEGAADGSGTSPVNATAPDGTGTYYLYTVAKNGTYYSDVVKRSYTIVAAAPSCEAPSSVTVSSPLGSTGWAYIKGETIQMHANVTGGSGTPHYTWQKKIDSEFEDIDGAPDDDDYEIANCTASNSGTYRCIVSTGDGCSTTSSEFDVKVYRVQILLSAATTDYDFTTIDRTEGYVQCDILLQENTDYAFKILEGHVGLGNNSATGLTSSDHDNWGMWESNANHVGLRTTFTDNYRFTWKFASASNNNTVSVTYPTHNQTADKTIYFDNSKTNWSNIYYRIGNAGHNENSGMVSKNDVTKVAGTANFYQLTTWAYNNFLAWHFADNTSWSGDHSIYKTDGTGYVINNHTAWQKYIVSETITLSPTTNDGGTPKVWSVDKTTGMKTYTVTSSATNCTITLEKCTNYGSGTYTALSSGGTVMPTQYVKVTVTPSTGYEWNSFSVSGTEGTDYDVVTAAAAGTPGVYIIMGDVTFTASCSVSTYDITYHDGKGMDFSGSHATGHPTTHTYGTATDLKTATKSGYVFGGWYDNNSFTGDPVTSLGATTYTGDIDLYAKWEKDVYLNLNGQWSTDGKYFAVYCWNNSSAENTWVWMELAEVCSSPAVYKATIPSNYYDRIIFVHKNSNTLATWDNKEHQSADLEFPGSKDQYTLSSASGGDGGKAEGSWASNYSAPTYTISFAANGGSGSMSSISSIACDANQTITANAFTKTGYSFAGWKANVNVTIDDETVTAGSIIANSATIQNVRSNITLTAQWTQIMVTGITLDPTSKTLTIDETQTITPTVLPETALDKTVTWTTSDGDVATVDNGVVTAVGAGTATITATANDGSGIYAECAITVEEAASCSGDPTALVSGTVYQAAAMLSNCAAAISGTGQQIYGLSSNGKFYIVGTTNDNDGSTGTVEIKNETNNDIGGDTDADFSSVAYLKMAGSQSHHSIKFVVPSAGTLTIWGYTKKGNNGDLQIKPQGGDAVTLITHSTDNNIKDAVSTSVTAGTYYILSNGGGAAIYGLRFEELSVPNVSNLDVDDGATLSSIPLSWTIPGICDLSKPKAPSHNAIGTIDNIEYLSTATRDSVIVEGDAPKWEQYGVGFDIPATTGIEWFSFDFYGNGLSSDVVLWGGLNDASDSYWEKDKTIKPLADKTWYNSGNLIPSDRFWHAADISTPMSQSITQVAIYLNSENYDNNDQSFSVRNVRYHVSGQNDIDHIVLMRKEGSAATGIADPSATKLYEGTKSHYTDASDVTGKNYYYTVFAVHASGAVSTGVSTSLTLYTITYNAGAKGEGSIAAGKKTGGFDFTLSSSTFTRDGFTQDGWSTSDGGDKVYNLGQTYTTDADITLYPHWVAVSGPVITNGSPSGGTIAITSDGETPILSAVTGNTVYIAATPSTGYNFTSWDVYKTEDSDTKVSLDTDNDADGKTRTFTMPSYAVTVNASFAAKTYTVTLNGNGGTGNTANVTATYGSSSFSSSITNPTLTGYVFDGWYSGEDGTGTLIISSAGVLQSSTTYSDGSGNWTNDGAVTLYAKWTRDVDQAKWGLTFRTFPDNSNDKAANITITTAKTSSKDGSGEVFGGNQYYNFGNGEYLDINLDEGYEITGIKTSAHFDPWRDCGGDCYDVDTKLYINFSGEYTYSSSAVLNAEPIQLVGNSNGDLSTKSSIASIPSGAKSARIFAVGSYAFGGDLFYLEVQRTALDCTPSTVTFAGGGATLGSAPAERTVCGELTLPGSASLVYPGYLFSKWNDGEDDYDIGDSYDVTEDVTFTAQWVVDNTSLRIPGSVVTLNNGNDARTTGTDNSTIDIDGDGNTDAGISLIGNKYAEWNVYITPGVYNVKSTLCVPSWGIYAKVSLIDPAGLEDPVEIYNTGETSGSSGVYKRYSVTKKFDFTSLTANKRYIVRVEDLWSGGDSQLFFKDIVFTPLYDVTITADPDDYGDVDVSSLDDVVSGTAISASSNELTVGSSTITASPKSATDEYTYAFVNWTKSDGTALPATVTADLAVRANFTRTPKSYTLTWDFGGGSTSDDDYTTGSVAYGTTLDYPASNTMSKSGYDFAGWSTDASTMPAEALTITAQWAERFTVTYNPMEGSVTPTSTIGSSVNPVTLPTPTHASYSFLGWYNTAGTKVGDADEEYTPTANITLYAKWQGDCAGGGGGSTTVFSLTSITGVGSGLTTSAKDVGAYYDASSYCTLNSLSDGVYVGGCANSGSFSNRNLGYESTYNAWSFGQNTIYLALYSATGFKAGDVVTMVVGTSNTQSPAFAKASASTLDDLKNTDYNYYSTYHLTMSSETAPASGNSYTYTGTLPKGFVSSNWLIVYRPGQTFKMQSITVTRPGSTCYTVTYDGNGATSGYVNDPRQYTSGANPEVLDCGYTRTGYAFMGWADGTDHRDAGTVDYQPGNHITSISDDVTLYAIWKQIKYFTGAASTTSWNTDGNWSPSGVPAITDPVVIQEDVTVDTDEAQALSVDIESGNTLTINAGQALIIEKTLTKAGGATAATDVIINSTRAAGTGALVIGGETGTNKATVNFETKVKRESGTGNWINQFIGSPFSDLEPYVDYALQIYAFRPNGLGNRGYWHSLSEGDEMEEFVGHNILYNDNNYLDVQWTGTLNASSDEKTLTGYYGSNTYSLFANSWVAPIRIGSFESDDFENMDATIYIFNAGTPQQEKEMGAGNGAKTDAGTYAVIPISSGEWIEGTLEVIPAMQAFFVKANAASPSLTLDYSKLVYTPALTSVGITPTRAPRRSTEEEAPEVIRLRVAGENGWAETTYLLGREDFTEGFDNGWDGRYMEGEDTNPQLYAPTGDGNMAVNCVPQIEGTVLGFRKGNADSQYTFSFEYAGEEEYYLKDLKLDIETQIDNESTYAFTAEAGDNAARFIIVRKTPAVATGVDNVDGEGAKVRKLIINDKVYIIRGGRVYSVDGALVK